MTLLKKLVVHPFLFAIYPILALYATNQNNIGFEEILRSILVSIGAALTIFILLRLLNLNHQKNALVISIGAIFFFSFGHILTVLADAQIQGFMVLQPEIVTLCWLIIWIVLSWAAIRLAKTITPITMFLNVVSMMLVGMTIIQLTIGASSIPYHFDRDSLFKEDLGFDSSHLTINGTKNKFPDIYYIILDSYGRQDMLESVMGFDNSSFIQSLQQRGFYIAQDSTSNYGNTAPSIASSLNFGYVNQLTNTVGDGAMNYYALRRLINENRLFQVLRQYGYEIFTYQTGYSTTEIHTSDQYIKTGCGLNSFETMIIKRSFAILWSSDSLSNCYKDRIIEPLEHMLTLPVTSKPRFVFVHIMAAHPPYVFGSRTESFSGSTHVVEDTRISSSLKVDFQNYIDQVAYVNSLILEMIDEIQEKNGSKPVIILQGDHGSGMYMDWQSAENTCFAERKAILNAYYFPDGKTSQLYPSITPVNSFRVVLSQYLETNLPLLIDKNYFSLSEYPYDFIDVTEDEGDCPFR